MFMKESTKIAVILGATLDRKAGLSRADRAAVSMAIQAAPKDLCAYSYREEGLRYALAAGATEADPPDRSISGDPPGVRGGRRSADDPGDLPPHGHGLTTSRRTQRAGQRKITQEEGRTCASTVTTRRA